MTQIYANNFTTLVLGRRGENLARKVVFDIRDLESLYGTGDVEVIYQRPGDTQPYPLAVQRDGTLVTWDVTSTDTEMSDGPGKCELRYYVGEVLAKSKTWQTWVEPSMETPSETAPPEPEQGWVDQIISVGSAAKESADAAKADADRAAELAAEVAAKAAQTAQNASDAAKAMDAAQTAQRLAEEAQGAAKASEDNAAGSVSAAEQSAQKAKESAAVYDDVVADVNQLKQDLSDLAPSGAEVGQLFRVAAISVDGKYTMEPVDVVAGVTINGNQLEKDANGNAKITASNGLAYYNGVIYPTIAGENHIDARNSTSAKYRLIEAYSFDYAVKAAMCDGKGASWTADEQAAARVRIGIDKPFELIEEIVCDGEAAGYTRTVDVNGNPYNLSSVYIEFEINAGNSYSSPVFFRAYDAESNTVLYDGGSVKQKNYVSYLLGGVDAKNGMYQGWMVNGNIDSYNRGGSNIKRINRRAPIISPIKKIYINVGDGLKFLSGNKIRIYGVRA